MSDQSVHMNGRVYDYNLGRFLSVDPFIQSPSNSQSMNPYSYIMNNPLAGTDPSGYRADWDSRSICNNNRCGSGSSDVSQVSIALGNGRASIALGADNVSVSGVEDIGSQTKAEMNPIQCFSWNPNCGPAPRFRASGYTQTVTYNAKDSDSESDGENPSRASNSVAGNPTVNVDGVIKDTVNAVKDTLKLLGGKGGPLITILAAAVTPSQLGNSDRQDIYSEYTDEQITRLREADAAGTAFAAEQIKNNKGKRTVLIGENQSGRVIPAAVHHNALVIGAPRSQIIPGKIISGSFNELVALTYNVAWTQGFKSAGYDFLDIGIDKTRNTRSPYYAAEKFTLGNYPKVHETPWD